METDNEPRAKVPSSHLPTSPVRILLVADVRSPTTWGWVEAVRSAGVAVLGTDGLPWPERRHVSTGDDTPGQRAMQRLRAFAAATPRRLMITRWVRDLAGPLLAPFNSRQIRRVVRRTKPDLVHALRIPSEAMIARAACPPNVPLAVSIWGNDLTLHASKSRATRSATRKVLARTDLLFADCHRDIKLAQTYGLRPATPTAVLPGGGGINLSPVGQSAQMLTSWLGDLAGSGYRLVVNPRGCCSYVRNDVLLDALSLLATNLDPCVRMIFVDSAQDVTLQRSIARHRLRDRIVVTGKRSPGEVLALFGRAEVSVSITNHDGTPNSLLEAMAAGTIPVCGDLPSIREWIEHGKNGFVAPFDNPQAIANALRRALSLSAAERQAIKEENARIIAIRAERGWAGRHAAEKYGDLVMGRYHDTFSPPRYAHY
jgi:glycosyltransferase involved in cell wall biosynthesis